MTPYEAHLIWHAEQARTEAEFRCEAQVQGQTAAAVAGFLGRILRTGRGRQHDRTPLAGRLSPAR